MINLVGKKFGRLTVIKRMDSDKWGHHRWLCKCNCGKEKTILGYNLSSDCTQSCGCLHNEGNNATHGHTQTKTYHSWIDMIQRCANPNNTAYHNYGGRGIKVCKRWMKFIHYLEDMSEAPEGYQIDRINNDGNYCKSNCRWVTSKTNNRNRRDNHLETYKGKTQCLAVWAEEYQIPYGTLLARINRLGWSIEKALTTPTRRKNSYA